MGSPNLRMNWGVPDYREKDDYPKPDDLTLTEWRWEFLRRRNDYREDFLLHREEELNLPHRYFLGEDAVTPDSPDFRPHLSGSETKYGVHYLRDPAAASPGQGQFRRSYGSIVFDAKGEVLPKVLEQERIAVTFDIREPLQPQFDEVKEHFERYLHEHGVIIRQRRRHKDKWSLYLRVIDARADGATWEQIGETVLLPNQNESCQTEYDGLNSENLPQLARGIWERAQELMNNFPA